MAAIKRTLAGKNHRVRDEKKARATPRSGVTVVRATGKGTSKPQEGSIRNAVLQFIIAAPKKTASIEDIEKKFKHPCRGYVQKLLEKDHLVVVQ